MAAPRRRITEIESLKSLEAAAHDLTASVVQGLDLSFIDFLDPTWRVSGAVFLGCTFRDLDTERILRDGGATLFPAFTGLPYNP